MNEKITEIATRFVDLAQKYGYAWSKAVLFDDEIPTLTDIVSAAGFESPKITRGKLQGSYRDEDGPTGEKYDINTLCPYKVDGDYHATGWLDAMLYRVVRGIGFGKKENRDELIQAVAKEIARSNPLVPIQLTSDGDILTEYPPSIYSSYLIDHTTDDKELGYCVGVHAYCNGWMDRTGATKTHSAIVCRQCHLRVLFPNTVKTYGELRQALTALLAKTTG